MSVIDSESLKFWSLIYSLSELAVIIGVVLEGAEFFSRRLRIWRRIVIEPWYERPPGKEDPGWVHNVGDFGFWILVAGLVFGQIAYFHTTPYYGNIDYGDCGIGINTDGSVVFGGSDSDEVIHHSHFHVQPNPPR